VKQGITWGLSLLGPIAVVVLGYVLTRKMNRDRDGLAEKLELLRGESPRGTTHTQLPIEFSARDQFPFLATRFDYMTRIGTCLCSLFRGIDIAPGQFYKGVLVYFGLKALKTHCSIEHLLEDGYIEDSKALLRSLLELVIQLKYISQEPSEREKRAKLYMEYEIVARWHLMQADRKLHGQDTAWPRPDNLEAYEQLQDEYNRVKENYPQKYSWSGLRSIKKMAEQVGFEREYDYQYAVDSQFVHSGPLASRPYISACEEGMKLNFLPDNPRQYTQTMRETCLYSLDIINRFWETFHPGSENTQICRLNSEFVAVFP